MQGLRKFGAVAIASVLLLATAAAGCGGSSDADQALEDGGQNTPLTAEDRLVERKLVNADEVERQAPGSVERAFIAYWSAVTYREWSVAANFLSDEVRGALDPQYLADAFELENATGTPVKPMIRDVVTTRGQTTVRYYTRSSTGELRPTSMAWVRRGGEWFIRYSPTLDSSYGSAVQQAVQAEVNPTATEPSKAALRAAASASREQAKTLGPASPGDEGVP